MHDAAAPLVFVVRLTGTRTGGLSGVVERVRTGQKRRFEDLARLGALITEMAAAHAEAPFPPLEEDEP